MISLQIRLTLFEMKKNSDLCFNNCFKEIKKLFSSQFPPSVNRELRLLYIYYYYIYSYYYTIYNTVILNSYYTVILIIYDCIILFIYIYICNYVNIYNYVNFCFKIISSN